MGHVAQLSTTNFMLLRLDIATRKHEASSRIYCRARGRLIGRATGQDAATPYTSGKKPPKSKYHNRRI